MLRPEHQGCEAVEMLTYHPFRHTLSSHHHPKPSLAQGLILIHCRPASDRASKMFVSRLPKLEIR
jgi:hypothetical protein